MRLQRFCKNPAAAAAGNMPVGGELLWPGSTPPTNFLEEDGSGLDTSTYADLFAEIGYTYGGSGSTFNLPDARGEHIRGWDHGAGNDPDAASRTDRGDGTTGDNVGTKQLDGLKSHNHSYYNVNDASGSIAKPGAGSDFGWAGTGGAGPPWTGDTRGRNTYRMICIKYQ